MVNNTSQKATNRVNTKHKDTSYRVNTTSYRVKLLRAKDRGGGEQSACKRVTERQIEAVDREWRRREAG